MDLFVPRAVTVVCDPFEAKLEKAIAAVTRLMLDGVPLCVAYSGGKDSTAVAVITFAAAERALAGGGCPRILVINADTGVESPVVHGTAMSELARMETYAAKLGIEFEVAISRPKLLDTWGAVVLGGRALPSVPERNGDCTMLLKAEPIARLRKKLLPRWSNGKEVCTLTGVRMDESIRRGANLRKRGESDIEPVRNKLGELMLAPIMAFDVDDVWELIGRLRSGLMVSYTDGDDVMTVYRDAGPTTCAALNEGLYEGVEKKVGGRCSSRFGCLTCTAVREDRSTNELLAKGEQYAYLAGAAALRNYIVATDYDVEGRLWVGRTIREQYIAVRPDVYSPAKLRSLFRMACTVDAVEIEAARAAGLGKPRFQLVPLEVAFAVDALWSLNGHIDGFAALDDWTAIHLHGARYPVPVVDKPLPKVELPEARFLKVGESWEQAAADTWAGLLDPVRAGLMEGCMEVQTYGRSKPVTAWESITADEFEIDMESALLFLEFELDEYLERYRHLQEGEVRGHTYRTFMQYGLMKVSPAQVARHDVALKRTHWKRINGLTGPGISRDAVLARSVGAQEVPRSVLEAFVHGTALRKLDEKWEREAAEERQRTLF